jgi:hypothetical protein
MKRCKADSHQQSATNGALNLIPIRIFPSGDFYVRLYLILCIDWRFSGAKPPYKHDGSKSAVVNNFSPWLGYAFTAF